MLCAKRSPSSEARFAATPPAPHGSYLKREGAAPSLWSNPETGQVEAVPRHTEIADLLARKICRGLSIPQIGR